MKTWIEINKRNLLHNLGEFRHLLTSKTEIMAVVKANAYGHGLLEIAKILAPKNVWFGVDNCEEGIQLRNAGIKNRIAVLGYTPFDDLRRAVAADLELVAYNLETIRRLGALRKPSKIHLKIETGTTRQGVGESDLPAMLRLIKKYPAIKLEGLSTHFANVEDVSDRKFARAQLERFIRAKDIVARAGFRVPYHHTACTAAAISFPASHFNLARIGIGMYGLWSMTPQPKPDLRPVLSWKALIAQVKSVKKGTPISYGLTERVIRDSKVAVIPVGYSDGFDRGLSSIGNIVIRGKRAKVLGRVCMNMFMVDVTDIVGVRIEDEATLIGKEITADEIAKQINTINYEVVARIAEHLPRRIV